MEFKKGKGIKSNSSTWTVCYDENQNKYTAKTYFGSDMGTWLNLYEITKDIYDSAGTFEDDDYKTQELIQTGRLLYSYENCKWGNGPILDVLDAEYIESCAWAFEKQNYKEISMHAQTDFDTKLIELAEIITQAFASSYKPWIASNWKDSYSIKRLGSPHWGMWYLIDLTKKEVVLTCNRLNEIIPFMFKKLGCEGVKWEKIEKSRAVLYELSKKYGTETFCVKGYEFHPYHNECLIASEYVDGIWTADAYYSFDSNAKLKKQTNKN